MQRGEKIIAEGKRAGSIAAGPFAFSEIVRISDVFLTLAFSSASLRLINPFVPPPQIR